jgi:hypothetical protein
MRSVPVESSRQCAPSLTHRWRFAKHVATAIAATMMAWPGWAHGLSRSGSSRHTASMSLRAKSEVSVTW